MGCLSGLSSFFSSLSPRQGEGSTANCMNLSHSSALRRTPSDTNTGFSEPPSAFSSVQLIISSQAGEDHGPLHSADGRARSSPTEWAPTRGTRECSIPPWAGPHQLWPLSTSQHLLLGEQSCGEHKKEKVDDSKQDLILTPTKGKPVYQIVYLTAELTQFLLLMFPL